VAGPGTFQVVTANDIWPLEGRWQSIAAKIVDFAPDVVLFVGFFSPLLAWAWKHYPVVGLSLHTLPPLGPVDVWLQQFEAGETLPAPWEGLPPPVPFPYAFRLALPSAGTASLARLNLPPDALIMVTVGYRLSREIRPEWAAQVLARLEAHPRWVWLLVGDSKAPPCLPSGHPRIRVLDHQDRIDELLQQCSLYLNPSRMGGGFSIMNAIARGVPVVSLGGSDGGDKLGPWSVATGEDYWRRVDELMADETARFRCGHELSRRFDRLYNLRSATPSLLAALQEGRSHFRQRTGANE
jgi:glycosyltransferase involved in cell wall biosynthesis